MPFLRGLLAHPGQTMQAAGRFALIDLLLGLLAGATGLTGAGFAVAAGFIGLRQAVGPAPAAVIMALICALLCLVLVLALQRRHRPGLPAHPETPPQETDAQPEDIGPLAAFALAFVLARQLGKRG